MSNTGLFQRLVLAAVLAVGFLCVWGVAGIWALEMVRVIVLLDGGDEHVVFRTDGTPLVMHSDGQGNQHYWDLEGNPVLPVQDDPSAWLIGTELPRSLPLELEKGDVSWEERIRSFEDGRTPPVRWHFISDGRPDGMAYFAGYDSQSKMCIGYLGAARFQAELPPMQERIPFGGFLVGPPSRVFCPDRGTRRAPAISPREAGTPEGALSPWMVYVLGRDQKLYEADLRTRTVRIVLDEAGLRSVALVRDSLNPARASFYRLAARTDDAVLVLDEHGRELRRYPIPEMLRDRTIAVAETSGGEALMYWNSPEDLLTTQVEYRICWVRPDGRFRTSGRTLPYHNPFQSMQTLSAAVVPSPLALDVLLALLRNSSQERREADRAESLPEAMVLTLVDFWPSLAVAQLLALGLAVLCYRRQLRYGASRGERIVWPLFVLLLGLPGWIGYRFGRRWPVLEKCPTCGDAVPRDRGDCVRCTTEIPLPALKGTEVFA
ncbi:MAG TPA: hypothetical protein VH643_33450 [Gemmataceae bacterium]|jgi:hypothetical protein